MQKKKKQWFLQTLTNRESFDDSGCDRNKFCSINLLLLKIYQEREFRFSSSLFAANISSPNAQPCVKFPTRFDRSSHSGSLLGVCHLVGNSSQIWFEIACDGIVLISPHLRSQNCSICAQCASRQKAHMTLLNKKTLLFIHRTKKVHTVCTCTYIQYISAVCVDVKPMVHVLNLPICNKYLISCPCMTHSHDSERIIYKK